MAEARVHTTSYFTLNPPSWPTEAGGVMDVNTALQEMQLTALTCDGLAHAICVAAKALDKHQAHLCLLAPICNEPTYVKLVEAHGAEHQLTLTKADDNKKPGEWVGLCKTDRGKTPQSDVRKQGPFTLNVSYTGRKIASMSSGVPVFTLCQLRVINGSYTLVDKNDFRISLSKNHYTTVQRTVAMWSYS
ncbi:hypothetical protein P7K49_020820 [Saguinus oedipus]|uniref:40S ribosomal protein S12 n=1 Tax=Saguinus oedipus TaxID=9490 RepID=A0ABQ9UT70_SAGOE|nr:hypothetical protein P7K49_020820 [Saguinus oedipus]